MNRLQNVPAPAKLRFAALEDRLLRPQSATVLRPIPRQGGRKSRDLTCKNRYPDFNIALSPINTRMPSGWELMVELNIPLQ